MSGGWRYSVRIPDYTEELQAEESIVSYQIDVLFQAPGSQEPSPPASVWRRFSEFRQLHTNLKASYPALFKGKLLDPPPKKSFFVHHDHKFLNERRVKLEQWMWKLLRHTELAQSRDMKLFLQLHLALRAANTGAMSPRSSVAGGFGEFGAPDERSEPDTDAFSEVSAPSGITTFSTAQTDSASMSGFHSSRFYAADGYRGDHMEPQRMGLRVEQRSDLKRLLTDLSLHIEKASRDIEESNLECARLRQENQNLEETTQCLTKAMDNSSTEEKDAKLMMLEQELKTKSNSLRDSVARVKELETALDEHSRKLAIKEQADKGQAQEEGEIIASLREQVRTLSEANTELEEKSVARKQKAKQDHKLLAKEIAKLRASTQALQLEVASLSGEKSGKEKAEQALFELQEGKAELESRVQDLEGMLKQQSLDFEQKLEEGRNAAVAAHSEKAAGMEGKVEVLEARCRDLSERIESLSAEKEQADALLLQANDRCGVSQQEFDEIKKALEADVLGAKNRCEEAERQLESLTMAHERLGKDSEEFRIALEQADRLASNAEGLQVEVERLRSEKLGMDAQREEAVVRAEYLVKELDVSREWEQVAAGHKNELDKLESVVKSLEEENLVLKQNQGNQAQLMEGQRNELLAENSRLKAENSELDAAREEIALLKSELEHFTLGNGNALDRSSHDEVLLEYEKLKDEVSENSQQADTELARLRAELQASLERSRALEEENQNLAGVREKLRLSELRAEEAAQASLQSAQKIAELEEVGKNLDSNKESGTPDDVSIAQIAELVRLQSEMGRLQSENAALQAARSAEENGGSGSHSGVANVAEVVRSIHAELRQCSASVPGLSGQTAIDPDVATDLMDRVAESNGKLQLIAAQALDLKTSSNSTPETSALGEAVSDMIGELVNKCREVNEIRVDQLLSRTEASVGPSTPSTAIPIPQPQLNPTARGRNQRGRSQSLGGRFSPDSGQGNRKGMLSRIAGSVGNSGELERGVTPGAAAEGDSRVKNFFGGIGSKVSTGALNFMQRGNPQLNFGDSQSQSQSLQQPLHSAPDHNSEESSRGN
ncbi:hypothetical protein BSKO_00826 [Bryopsis sp. KO-2023]|nr:hypothetical protein BSKO_00826 [Bryopsis sp. KO-2023]